MKFRVRFLAALILLVGTYDWAAAQNRLSIDTVSVEGIQAATVDIRMDNPNDSVEGFVLAIAYDTQQLSVTNVTVANTLTDASGAELVVPEIFEVLGGVTLGVVVDFSAPFEGQEIPAGTDQVVARLVAVADNRPAPAGSDLVVDLKFADRAFGAPPLANVLVMDGESIGVAQGLILNDGQIIVGPPPPDSFTIESVTVEAVELPSGENPSASTRILMTNQSGPAQGFVLAISHTKDVVNLIDINVDTSVTKAIGAELVVTDLSPAGPTAGGTLGVVLDFNPPFDAQTIPMGFDQPIASFVYECRNPVSCQFGGPPPEPQVADLRFTNGVIGDPPLNNVIVSNGLSVTPALNHGTFVCIPAEVFLEDTEFFCGAQDPTTRQVGDVEGVAGQIVDFSFFYTDGVDPDPNDGMPACLGNSIQAFQMSIAFDCRLEFMKDTFTVDGTILDAVGAEFVNVNIDNNPNDLDGTCDMTVGMLLDALPPFDGHTAPFSCEPLRMGTLKVRIGDTAPCGESLPVRFQNGMDGNESIALDNLVVIDNRSLTCLHTNDGQIRVIPPVLFTRGDCNGDLLIDLADAQASISLPFWDLDVPCLDACDSNDDGAIDIADVIFLVAFLFGEGSPLPAPGPTVLEPGADPTEDELGCDNPAVCP